MAPYLLERSLQNQIVPGVPESSIVALLKSSPEKIGSNPEKFKSMVEELQKLGLRLHGRNFIEGIMVMVQLTSSTWDEKINLYMRYGWTEFEILDAFKKQSALHVSFD